MPARGRRRRSGRDLRARRRDSPIASEFQADEVVYVSLGEGATSEGEFWESLNTACSKRLPVALPDRRQRLRDLGARSKCRRRAATSRGWCASFPGLHVASLDGTDFFASLRALREAVAYVRARKGPAFVHAHVIRPYSHSLSDDEKLYKTPDEREAEARRDPITRLPSSCAQRAGDRRRARGDRREVEREVDDAAIEALKAPQARRGHGRALRFSPTSIRRPTRSTRAAARGKPDTMVAAINRTLKDEMARDPRIVVFGEDVADASARTRWRSVPGKGGVFKVTHGLQRAYGDDRVFNSPLAEANIVGRAVGMATRGLKPVVEIQFFDYIWPAMMQLRDEMSMLRYRSGNNWSCPMVVRVPIGGYLRGGAPVSQPVGRQHLRALPGHPHRVPVQRDRCRRPAAHRDPVRRPGALPRAQAPLSPDLQQGRLSRAATT